MTTAIVGGGISGLALAHELAKRAEPILVFESGPRVGGVIQTKDRDGFLTETGPNGFIPGEPAMTRLIASLGLGEKVRASQPAAKRRYIYTRGTLRMVPLSPPAFLRSDLLRFSSRLRVLGELFVRRARRRGEESLASFANRHFGKTASRVVVDAVQSGIFAGDPLQLSVRSAFPKLFGLEQQHRSLIVGMLRQERQRPKRDAAAHLNTPGGLCTFDGGLETLVSALGRSLGEKIHLGTEVRGLARPQGRWTLLVSDRSGQTAIPVDRVVLAIPAYAAARLFHSLEPTLGFELESISYAPVAVVHLGYSRTALSRLPEGFGFLTPFCEHRRLLGALFISSVFPWRSPSEQFLITCMVGGARQAQLASLDGDSLLQLVKEELQSTLGIEAAPTFHETIRWERAIPQYNLGHDERLKRIDAALTRFAGLYVTGSAYRGVGINDCVRQSLALAEELEGVAAQRL